MIEKQEKVLSRNKQVAINIIASFVALAVNMGINFFLSKYIVAKVGVEAYGFVQLTNNILNYFSILTIALNSMSSRFISISYFQKDVTSANQYFSSTFFADLILSAIFFPILVIAILNVSTLLNISSELVFDVQMLMIFMLANFIVGLLATNLGISYYVKNQLYRASLINIIVYIIRAALLLILFGFCKPQIAFVSFVGLIVTCITQIFNLHYKKVLTPELKIQKNNFSWKKVKELLSAGVWNSITQLGNVLQEGLDLLITNLFISATDMGILSIVKIIPGLINALLATMVSTFLPSITEFYANGRSKEMVSFIRESMKLIGMLINIPIAVLIAYGDVLFSLWFPSQNAQLLHILSIITILPWAIMGQATIIHNLFNVLNRLKVNSMLVLTTGALNIIVVFILLKTTSLGLFAVAGVSSIFSILRNLLYTVPFGAKYIGQKWTTFYPEILKSMGSVIVISVIGLLLKKLMPLTTWLWVILFCMMTAGIGFLFNYLIVFNRNDRLRLKNMIKNKMKRG